MLSLLVSLRLLGIGEITVLARLGMFRVLGRLRELIRGICEGENEEEGGADRWCFDELFLMVYRREGKICILDYFVELN